MLVFRLAGFSAFLAERQTMNPYIGIADEIAQELTAQFEYVGKTVSAIYRMGIGE